LANDGVYDLFEILGLAHVAFEGGPHIRKFLKTFFITTDQTDGVALLGEHPGCCFANSTAGSSDENDF
jgi:hypothetical protein